MGRGGVEPPTHGFSVRAPADITSNITDTYKKDNNRLPEILPQNTPDAASMSQDIQAINQLLENADPAFIAALKERLINCQHKG